MPKPDPTPLMAVVDGDAELVLVDVHDQAVDLTLDDGHIIQLNRAELRAALDRSPDHAQAA